MKSGWVTKKLGEVCESISTRGCQIQQNEICDIGKFPVVSQSEAFIEGYTDFESAIESVPVVLFGDHTCCVKYIDFPFVVGADGTKLLTSKQFEVKFLYYAILRVSASLVDGKYRRHFKDLKKSYIPIPPLSEQKRIVKKIDAAFEKIDALKANAEKNLANAKELFQSALDEAMRPKKGWVEKRLGDVANIRVGPFGSSLHKADYVENGVPLVNPCHMKDSKISNRISTQVSPDKAKSLTEYRLKAGDIVFARRGEIGRLAFVSEKEDGYLCGTGSLFARFKERYDIQFLYFLFSSKSFVEKLEMLSTGTTMKSINSSALESMCFSVPTMNEQQRLAKQLDSLSQKTETLQQNYAQQIANCAEMRQAILREAFEGRL